MGPSASHSPQGLSHAHAAARLREAGPNDLPRERRRGLPAIVRDVLREPMLALLLVAGLTYFLLGDHTEAAVLLLFGGVSIVLTVVQEYRTERVLEALRDLSAPRALVLREGVPVRIPGREVVAGDVLVLEAGDRVAADGVLLAASNLTADESLLTGESLAVTKDAAEETDTATQVYAGTVIVGGNGLAEVTATGPRSQMGQIGRLLAGIEGEVPRLQRETAHVVRICAAAGIGVAGLVTLLYGLLRGGWLDALLAGIATAMSLLPEEFPVVLTIFLAMGSWRIAQAGVLTRRASAIETLGAATVLCTDKTGTLTQNRMAVVAVWLPDGTTRDLAAETPDAALHELLMTGALASSPVPVDPMEIAFHEAARQPLSALADERTLLHTTGLAPGVMAMSNVWRMTAADDALLATAKGAPEAIAALCGLAEADRQRLEAAAGELARRGMRVLGVATARLAEADARRDHREHAFSLSGLVGLSDPLRPGVPEAVAQCRSAGIRVVMITGDYPATAEAIGAEAGFAPGDILTGETIAALDDAALTRRMATTAICARTVPTQKLRIVEALKACGDIVAMTGDGVNDAPALKAAHIGIAMGRRGTDVAREAAALVLIEDDFGAIVAAIGLGRRIHDNIRKAIAFIIAVHLPIAVLALLPVGLGLPIILGPLQIALLELVIDPTCALVFEAGQDERDAMHRPPRSPGERLFSRALVTTAVGQGAAVAALLGTLLVAAHGLGLPPMQLRTAMFLALIGSVLALVLAQAPSGAIRVPFRRNTALRIIFGAVAAGLSLILWNGTAQHLLGFAPLPWPVAAGTLAVGPLLLAGLLTLRKTLSIHTLPRTSLL
jgi:Ca2+-transporting ATPase